MKFCTIAYLPPYPKFSTPEFKANVLAYKTAHPLILFSDTAHPDVPNVLKIGNPEPVTPYAKRNRWFCSNRVFLTAAIIAKGAGYTHFCYLECDCRVGQDHWDKVVWNEFCDDPKPIVVGGTIVTYNPCNTDRLSAVRWGEMMRKHSNPGKLPLATYGSKASRISSGSCPFVMGALGVYSVSEIGRLFDLTKSGDEAAASTAWDMEIGLRMWKVYGPDSFYLLGHLPSVYSSNGNVLNTEAERLQWLAQGKVVAVHQIKGNDAIGDRERHPSLEA